MFINVTKQDGNLATLTEASIKWQDFAGGDYENDKLYKIESDSSQFNNNISVGGQCYTFDEQMCNFYDNATSNWVLKHPYTVKFPDLEGLNIIYITGQKPYICTDEQSKLIPNYLTKTTIRYRINESVTVDNLPSFYHYQDPDNIGTLPVCYVCVGPAPAGHTTSNMNCFGVASDENGVGLAIVSVSQTKTYTISKGSREIAVSMRINDQGYIDSTIESRLSTVEYKVSIMEDKMKEYDKIIKDIPAITAALQSEVTKFYVAR